MKRIALVTAILMSCVYNVCAANFSDDFDRPDATSIGNDWSLYGTSASFSIAEGSFRISKNNAANVDGQVHSVGRDFTYVKLRIRTSTTASGSEVQCYFNTGTYSFDLNWHGSWDGMSVNGTQMTSINFVANQWYLVEFFIHGNTVDAFVDGVQRLASVPMTAYVSNPSIMLGCGGVFGAFTTDYDYVQVASGGTSPGISAQSANQRSDGTGKVDINYYLTVPYNGTASVTLTFSSNGGTSWSITPQSGSLSGDYGSGISAGSRSIQWNAAAQLSASTYNNNFRARLVTTASGTTITNISSPFTVDLRGLQGGLTAAGKVRHATTKQGLSGVSVSLAGQNTTTASDGSYSFANVVLANGNTITASKSGFATYTGTVPAPAGTIRSVPLDINLSSASGVKPVVTHVSSRYENATFLAGIPIENTYRVGVDWADGTPNEIWVYVNGQFSKVVPASGPLTDVALNMGFGLFGSLRIDGNKIRFVARDTQGHESDPFDKFEKVIPLPSCLNQLLASGDQAFYDIVSLANPKIKFEIPFPDPNIPSFAYPNKFPLIGRFGTDFHAQFGLEYELLTGNYELWAGLGSRDFNPSVSWIPKPKFFLGDNFSVNFGFDALARGYWSPYQAPIIDRVGARVYVDGEYLINTFYILDVAPGGQIFHILDVLTLVGVDINSVQQVNLYGLLKLEADATARLGVTPVCFDEITLAMKAGLKAAYEPDLVVAHCSIYAGGLLGLEIQLTDPIGPKKVLGEAFVGIKADAFGIRYLDSEFVVFNGTFWQREQSSMKSGAVLLGDSEEQWICIPVKTLSAHPIPRNYLKAGSEGFALASAPVSAKSAVAADSARLSPLDAFRLMKQNPVSVKSGASLFAKSEAGSPQLAQAELPIISNAFPYSEPTLAGYGQELMLLWVADNANVNDLQYADIRWSRFDGTDWSAPTSIMTDTRADFAPKVSFDGNGDAIAVWQKVTDPNFTNATLSAMAAEMEIVWSRWDRASGEWTEPAALTGNSCYDGSPLLAGPLSNGDLLAAWTMNEANLLMGTGAVGAVENDAVLMSRWNAADLSWSAPEVVVSNLAYRLSQSFAGVSNRAVYAWTTDADGVLTNDVDQDVFARSWSNGVWAAKRKCSPGGVADKSVRAAVSPQGVPYLVWQSSSNLVYSKNLSLATKPVRADSTTAGFADYAMTYGPQGNMVLLWQEMTTNGSDAHYSVYDPLSDTWSKDATFFNDSPLERSFSPVWDSAGQLNFAYNKVEIIITNETVELEGGGSVTISNVPQQGRVDIAVAVRRLITDVAVLPGDFTVEGANYLPNDALTLSANLRNVGDVAVTNAAVAFYDGNPSAGGTLITNIAWSGWLEGAATNAILSTVWVVPEPATNRTLYAVANPAHAFIEFTENNNTQAVSIGGADLSVSLISATAETNGQMRVIAQVQNLGAPDATNTILAIRRQGQSGAPLASVEVPALEPGLLAQVALDLPDGTQPEGETLYTLKADEAGIVSDIDTNNNTATFAVNLWLDNDDDGMPNWWETEKGLDPNDFGDAAGDTDEDGISNYAEWRAGTDPDDPLSFLFVEDFACLGSDPATGGFRLSWGSVSNKFYTISRTSDLVNGQGFLSIVQHIFATPPANTYQDTSVATNAGPFFYRIEVE